MGKVFWLMQAMIAVVVLHAYGYSILLAAPIMALLAGGQLITFASYMLVLYLIETFLE